MFSFAYAVVGVVVSEDKKAVALNGEVLSLLNVWDQVLLLLGAPEDLLY